MVEVVVCPLAGEFVVVVVVVVDGGVFGVVVTVEIGVVPL